MAELAVGAVTSLLGLIRNEALLLGRLGSDVQFIKEEMESMNSFLKHLAKTVPRGPSDEHDEQVRTWMKQVRELAHDCSNCIDLYLQRGNPASHRYYSTGSLLQRLVCWAPWMVDKLLAQHYAANQLRELRRQAHDVGQRRLRYGVEVPKQPAGAEDGATTAASSALSKKAEVPEAAPPSVQDADNEEEDQDHDEDDEDDEDDGYEAAKATMAGRRALEPRSLDDYCTEKIIQWLDHADAGNKRTSCIPSIAIVAPDADATEGDARARGALAFVAKTRFKRSVWINLLNMHKKYLITHRRRRSYFFSIFYPTIKINLPARPTDILCYILRECQNQNKDNKDHGEAQEPNVQELASLAYQDRSSILDKINGSIQHDKLKKKIEGIESKIKQVETSRHTKEADGNKAEDAADGTIVETSSIDDALWINKPLGILFQALNLILTPQGETPERKTLGEAGELVMQKHENTTMVTLICVGLQPTSVSGMAPDTA